MKLSHIFKVAFVERLLLFLVLLGPPTLREGRNASDAFTSPLANLDTTYLLHLGVWIIAGVYVFLVIIANPKILGYFITLFRLQPSCWYMFFLFLALLSSIWSIFPLYTLFFVYKILVTILITLILVIKSIQYKQSPIRNLIQIIGNAYLFGMTLLTFLFLVDPSLVSKPSIGIINFRLTGGFLNDYGSYALLTFSYITTQKLLNNRVLSGNRVIYLTIIAWCIILLILAQTRSIWFAFFVILCLLIIFGLQGLLKRIYIVISLLAISITILSMGEIVIQYFVRGQSPESLLTLSARTIMFAYNMEIWKESPIIGFGYHAGSRSAAVQFIQSTGINLGAAHDIISKTLLDLGLLGGIIIIFALLSLWSTVLRVRKYCKRSDWLFLSSIAVYGTIHGIVGGGISEPWAIWPILFLTASLLGQETNKTRTYYSKLSSQAKN